MRHALTDRLWGDLAFAVRSLRRTPAFSITAVAILGVGIGMATAVFTVASAVLIQPLPVTDQDRIVAVWPRTDRVSAKLPLRYDEFERFREQSRVFTDVAAITEYGAWPFALRHGERALPLSEALVTGNFFRVLGTRPVLGRLLRPEDDVFGAEPVMVISHGLWQRAFGGDPSVLGRKLVHHGRNTPLTIVGVTPAGLDFPANADFWTPLVPATTPPGGGTPNAYLLSVGRLAPDVTAASSGDELAAFMRREVEEGRSEAGRYMNGMTVRTLPEVVTGEVRPALLVLTAAVALLVLVACTNIGNLLLVRASARRREIALRRALGAGYRDIVRQLMVESTLLAAAGGLAGLLLAETFRRAIVAYAPAGLPRLDLVRMAGVPFTATAIITLVVVFMFGLAPTLWAAREDLARLTGNARGGGETRGGRRARQALVAWQVALALVVLAAAGLLGRSLAALERLDMGFTTDRLAIVSISWPWREYDTPEETRAFYDRLMPRLNAIRGIQAATPLLLTPFSGAGGWDSRIHAEDQPAPADAENPFVNMEVGGPAYFRTFGMPILRGRGFTAADRVGSPNVVVVSEAVARRFWPREDPIGKRLRGPGVRQESESWTVVGVVGETRYRDHRTPTPTVYFPYAQLYAQTMFAVRTRAPLSLVVPDVRRAVQETAPDVVVWKAETLDELMGEPLAQPRMIALLLTIFGATTLLLAAIGVYGVMAFSVRQRTRELGIRVALGATAGALRKLVLRQALAVVTIGLVAGIAGALAGAGFLRSLLYEVSPADPLNLAAACAILLGAGLAAALLPARRATRVDPMDVMRQE